MAVVVVVVVGVTLGSTATASTSAVMAGEPVSWLAAGDSFSSGEGVPRAVGDCQQSEKAFGPRAARLLETEKDATIEPVVMTACTGAVTQDFFNRENKSHPKQTDWAADTSVGGLTGGRYDVATLSFGGNDVDFGGVMTDCLVESSWGNIVKSGQAGCTTTPEEMAERISKLGRGVGVSKDSGPFGRGGANADLATFYAQVAQDHVEEGGVLVVVGYPRLIAPSDQWPAWRNGRCGQLSAEDSDMIGDAAVLLDATTKASTRQAQSLVKGRTISYVSRLDIFDADGVSRSLCTRNGASWMNGVSSVTWTARKESPYHPNQLGHYATAERVAASAWKSIKINATSTPTPAPTPSTPTEEPTPEPTEDETVISDGSSTYGVGERFSDLCSVAWPTAPTITADSIEVLTFCQHMLEQFTFVHVSYPDPNLPLNPMTGFSLVEGTIVGTSTSSLGLKTLLVEADTYELDAG